MHNFFRVSSFSMTILLSFDFLPSSTHTQSIEIDCPIPEFQYISFSALSIQQQSLNISQLQLWSFVLMANFSFPTCSIEHLFKLHTLLMSDATTTTTTITTIATTLVCRLLWNLCYSISHKKSLCSLIYLIALTLVAIQICNLDSRQFFIPSQNADRPFDPLLLPVILTGVQTFITQRKKRIKKEDKTRCHGLQFFLFAIKFD